MQSPKLKWNNQIKMLAYKIPKWGLKKWPNSYVKNNNKCIQVSGSNELKDVAYFRYIGLWQTYNTLAVCQVKWFSFSPVFLSIWLSFFNNSSAANHTTLIIFPFFISMYYKYGPSHAQWLGSFSYYKYTTQIPYCKLMKEKFWFN